MEAVVVAALELVDGVGDPVFVAVCPFVARNLDRLASTLPTPRQGAVLTDAVTPVLTASYDWQVCT